MLLFKFIFNKLLLNFFFLKLITFWQILKSPVEGTVEDIYWVFISDILYLYFLPFFFLLFVFEILLENSLINSFGQMKKKQLFRFGPQKIMGHKLLLNTVFRP